MIERIGIKPNQLTLNLEFYQPTAITLLISLVVLHILLWSFIFGGKETK